MRKIKIIPVLFALMFLIAPASHVKAETSYYTYNYDYWANETESPDAYVPEQVILGQDLGVGHMKEPQGLFVRGDRVYICDSGNHRIIEAEYKNETFTLIRVIDRFLLNGEESTFKYPQDIYVTEEGNLYICDTDNQRVVVLDKDLNYINRIEKPTDETIDVFSDFYPMKIVVDRADRVYLLVKNVNKGLMEYDQNGKFSGYIGANEVKVSLTDYFWKIFSTKAQRSQMELFVPTEYNNLALDSDGFIYVTTITFSEDELMDDKAKPIRKLNTMGKDILIKNGYYPPIGDINWGSAGGVGGSSKFSDIVALENETYLAVDRVRGRIFGYDFQGNLLYAFGGLGNKAGYFQYPSAIEDIEDKIMVLDYRNSSLTVMKLTQYGTRINEALAEYKKGNYKASSDKWEEVLKLNGNYDLAYIGIGRSLLREGRYEEAMEYFELKYDDVNYSKAFKLYRKEWIEANIGKVLVVLVILIVVPKVIKIIRKIRREVLGG